MNTQINKLSMSELPDVLETAIGLGAHAWQIQLTAAMGRAADAPEVLLQPEDLLELFPLLARLKARCDEVGVVLWPGNNIGYFGPYESILRGGRAVAGTRRRAVPVARRSASRPTARSRAVLRCRRALDRRQHPRRVAEGHLGAHRRRSATCATARSTISGDTAGPATTPTSAAPAAPGRDFPSSARRGTIPLCHHRALEMRRQGKRERLVQVEAAPGVPFDNGRFEIIVEDDHAMSSSHLVPVLRNRHVMTDAGVCPFCPVGCPRRSARRRRPPRRAHEPRGSPLAGATLVGVSACSSEALTSNDAATDRPAVTKDASEDRGFVAFYGAPFPGTGGEGATGGTNGTGGATGTGGAGGTTARDAGEDRSVVAIYGAATPTDGVARPNQAEPGKTS